MQSNCCATDPFFSCGFCLAGEAHHRAHTAAPVALDADEQALLNQVIGYYHDTSEAAAPEALAYLQERGIDRPKPSSTSSWVSPTAR